jgi:DNA-binding CsgD family transcriptional regulator
MIATLQQGVRAGDHAASGLGALTLGGLALVAGRYRDAARWLAEAEIHFERRDTFGALMIARAFQVGVAAATAADGVAEALQRCQEALQGHEPLPNQLPYLVRAQGWASAALGDRPGAQRLLLGTADRLERMPLQAAQLQYEAMRAGASPTAVERSMSALSGRCDARLMAAYADHISARAANDGAALSAVAEEFGRIGVLRYATEAAAAAAAAYLEAGRQDSARRAAARSRELFVDGQGGTLPVIDGLSGAAVELSPREAQLVELAKMGLSNPQIAERLVLSKRTVESHLYRAMQKLGVSDRRDL